MMKRILLSGAMALQVLFVQAQCSDWKWPEDKSTAEEKNVLYTDAMNNGDFEAAKGPHRWLLENAPNLNTAIYINGEKIYKGLVEKTKDEAQKEVYLDSLMLIYDLRMEHCNQEADVMERKAYSLYRYTINNGKEAFPKILEAFDKAYELNGDDIAYYMHMPYMSVLVYNKKYLDNLTDAEILERYDKIIESIDAQIQKGGKYTEKLKEYRGKIDGLLVSVIDVDCDFVKKNLAPKFRENPDDLQLAKKIFSFMLNGKCTDDPLWLEAGKVIQQQEPNYGLAKNLGLKFKSSGDLEQAEEYFTKAIELTDDPSRKAEMYLLLGELKSGSEAMQMYRNALDADPSNKEAYNAIGNVYFQSYDECRKGQDVVKDRAVYLLAYDMYQKAGNQSMMQSASQQFPSKEDIFTYNYNKGDKITVDCWGQTTTIRSRD